MANDYFTSLRAVFDAAEAFNVSAGGLYALALRRSSFDPRRVRRGLPDYFGLFQFQQTQWRETLLAMGRPVPQALAADIMDPWLQSTSAAWLKSNNRSIRGEISG